MQQDGQATLRLCKIERPSTGSCGFHLSRTTWDPYPWISGVECGSAADFAGLQSGDCVLEVNGEDVLGQKIGQVASKVRARDDSVTLLLWNAGSDPHTAITNISGNGPTPMSLQRISNCLRSVLQLLECPVCLETIPPPSFQCCHGHVLCGRCRSRTDKCPVCRTSLGPKGRCLLADKLHNLLTSVLNQNHKKQLYRKNKTSSTQIQQRFHLRSRIETTDITVTNYDSILIQSISTVETKQLPSGEQTLSAENDMENPPFHCPYTSKSSGHCKNVSLDPQALLNHIRDGHVGPMIQYFLKSSRSVVKLRLPLSSSRSPPSSLTSFTTENEVMFFVQVASGASPGQRLVWLWLLGDGTLSDRYRLRLTLPEGDTHTGPVFPLTSSWDDVVNSNCCLSIQETRYNRANPEVRLEILDVQYLKNQ